MKTKNFQRWWNMPFEDDLIQEGLSRIAGVEDAAMRCSILSEFWAEKSWEACAAAYKEKIKELEEKAWMYDQLNK